jgi:hypothetical protein
MTRVFLNLDKVYLDKHTKSANEESIAMLGEEGKDTLVFDLDMATIVSTEINDSDITIDFDTKLGAITVEVPMDGLFLEQLISSAVKRLNKMKSLLESIK